jgi:hypothetical protein
MADALPLPLTGFAHAPPIKGNRADCESRGSSAAVLPELTLKERNSLHILYEYFRVVDMILDGYADRIMEARGTEKIKDYVELYMNMFQDILSLLDVAERLATNHLQGNPDDVLYSDVAYSRLGEIKYTKDV